MHKVLDMKKASDRKTTIYALAELAQTSSSTVSAILNGTWRQRRISEETANRVQALALEHRYSVNRQASGLRKSRSGLIGMIIPTHEDHFFGSMSQVFDEMARTRHLQPIVVSTLRDAELEVATVATLISYQIEYLVVAGATAPDAVSEVCQHHGVKHVNVDLPGTLAPSVTSDNYWGAAQLTAILIARSRPQHPPLRDRLYFIGGIAGDYATRRRVQGFADTVSQQWPLEPQQIRNCGYDAALAETDLRQLCASLGGLPRGIVFASSVVLEGAINYLKTLPLEELERCVFCCCDWNPFASYLRFPVHMTRQDVSGLMEAAFQIIDGQDEGAPRPFVEVLPHLVLGD